MLSILYRIFRPEPKAARSALRATEPERLHDWQREVEVEDRRARSLRALGNMERREAAERLRALPWWRRWFSRLARNPRRNGRFGGKA